MNINDGDRSTPVGRFFRNVLEKLIERYYEGPEPPQRIQAYAEEFARLYPRATRGQWLKFSVGLASTFYRSAWTRGFEWTDRDLDHRDPIFDPDRLAHAQGHDWPWAPGGTAVDLDDVVEEARDQERDTEEALLAQEWRNRR